MTFLGTDFDDKNKHKDKKFRSPVAKKQNKDSKTDSRVKRKNYQNDSSSELLSST